MTSTMNQSPISGTKEHRLLGLRIREEMLGLLTGKYIEDAISALRSGDAALELSGFMPSWLTEAVLSDMKADVAWSEEYWKLGESGDVLPVSKEVFKTCCLTQRFSWNECLRKPSTTAFCLRGFLSALTDRQAAAAFSMAYGEGIRFKSADIARYRSGHYLRRHADLFDDRRFGFVWFFGKDWALGHGGELAVESPSGEAIVISPQQGTVAVLQIKADYHHQVAVNRSDEWVRYSVASHYHSSLTDSSPNCISS